MTTERWRFEAVIYRVGQLRCVDVPARVSRAAAGSEDGRLAVKVRIVRGAAAGGEDRTSLVRKRDGGHRLFLSAPLRRAAAADTGDRVTAEVWPDARGGEPDLPEELVTALGRVAGGMEELLSRSPADRRQLVRWIAAPKSREARRRRVDKAVEMVLRGKPKKRR